MMRLEAAGKRYGRGGWVLRGVNAELAPGEVIAFTGGNGSGKSTLLRMLAGLTRPTSGTVTGRPATIGYVPDRFAPVERLTATAYLTHMGRIRGLPTHLATTRAGELLERLALAGGADAPLRTLSKGNAQKVALAQALLVRPELLVLDEPWSGLDASAHQVLAEIITEVADAGGTVVFTDHREAVTRARASRAYAVGGGRVTLQEAAERRPVAEVVLAEPGTGARALDWRAVEGVLAVRAEDARITLTVDDVHADALLHLALRHGWSVVGVTRETDR